MYFCRCSGRQYRPETRKLYFAVFVLYEKSKDTNDHSKQRHALDKSGDNDHVASDVSCRLRLTGDSLHGGGSNLTNAKTCANCRDACADSCSKT